MAYQAFASKQSELIGQLIALVEADEIPEFNLLRLEQEAKKLMRIDATGAHTVLGAIASLRDDAAGVRKHYEIALQQSGHLPDVWHNYAVSLMHAGKTIEAYEAAQSAFESMPDDLVALRNLMEAAFESAHFHEALELCKRWNRLSPDRPAPDMPEARMLAGALERGLFLEEHARDVLRVVHETRSAARVRQNSRAVFEDHTEPGNFLYKIYIGISPEKAVELNERAARRIVATARQACYRDSRFIFMFIGSHANVGHPRANP